MGDTKRTDHALPSSEGSSPQVEYLEEKSQGLGLSKTEAPPSTPSFDRQETLREHGPAIDYETPQSKSKPSHPDLFWPKARHYLQEPFSEFWGTFVLIMFGDGVVAQVILSGGEKGQYQSISWGWGLVFQQSIIRFAITYAIIGLASCSVCM